MTKRRNDNPEKRAAVRNASRPDAIESRLRARRALDLRIQGHSFREIGDMLGIDGSTACRDVARALRELCLSNQEQAEAMRGIEAERLDALTAALWPRAAEGELGAVDRLIAIAARRARLFGLDAPTKTAACLPDGTAAPVSEFHAMPAVELAAVLEKMTQQLKESTHAKKS